MEFLDGRERRRRDATRRVVTTTIARYHHHHRHLSHPQSLVTTTIASQIRLHWSRHHHRSLFKSKRDDSAKTMSQRLQVRDHLVVVVTREQELVLCRGDVSNLSPSRLTRMLQSLTGMPSAAFEAKTLLYTTDFKTIVLKYCGSLRKVEETDEP
ncbi:hypothetical protein YC2023_082447 [Brassica napus]